MRYYVDTCVWIDFVEDTYDIHIFTECLKHKDNILYSLPLQKELLRFIGFDQLQSLLKMLKSIILIVDVSGEEEAWQLSNARNIPFVDALHAIIARDNDATLVTRDKHFLRLNDVCLIEML